MWTYTLYILDAYTKHSKDGDKISFKDFSKFVFGDLWKNQKVVFHDTEDDLREDVKTLAELHIIDYNSKLDEIEIPGDKSQKMSEIVQTFRTDPMRKRIPLVNTYLTRVDSLAHP